MKKLVVSISMLVIIIVAATATAMAAIYPTYPLSDIADLSQCTNAIYLGVFRETDGSGSLLYKLGSDDLSTYLSAMKNMGYIVTPIDDGFDFSRMGSMGAQLIELGNKDEYCLRFQTAVNGQSRMLFSNSGGVLDPDGLYEYTVTLDNNIAQNINYYAMRKDDIATYIMSLQNTGFELLDETDEEYILRRGVDVISIRTMGEGRHSSTVAAVSIAAANHDDSDETAISAALEKSNFAYTYYMGHKSTYDSGLYMNSVYIIQVFAPGDRVAYIPADRLAEYKALGWYETTEEMGHGNAVRMFAADGREIYVDPSDVEAYKRASWDTLPPIPMFSADGREIYVLPKDIDAHRAVGWYLSQNEARKK